MRGSIVRFRDSAFSPRALVRSAAAAGLGNDKGEEEEDDGSDEPYPPSDDDAAAIAEGGPTARSTGVVGSPSPKVMPPRDFPNASSGSSSSSLSAVARATRGKKAMVGRRRAEMAEADDASE